jgi:hypothetical protein
MVLLLCILNLYIFFFFVNGLYNLCVLCDCTCLQTTLAAVRTFQHSMQIARVKAVKMTLSSRRLVLIKSLRALCRVTVMTVVVLWSGDTPLLTVHLTKYCM